MTFKDVMNKIGRGIGKFWKSKKVQNVLNTAKQYLKDNAPKLIEQGVKLLPMIL